VASCDHTAGVATGSLTIRAKAPADAIVRGLSRHAEPMIQHRVLSPGEFRRMPWRNGGGLTTEIMSWPPQAALDAFAWRVSIADVTKHGPFSHFDGIDRILVLIGGAGMRLDGAGACAELRVPFEPYSFRGEDRIDCALLDGAVRDFNVMTRRDAARGRVTVVQQAGERIAPARFTLCHAVTGACECLIAGHPPIPLAAEHALLLDDPESTCAPCFNPLSGDAIALVASIDLL